MAGYDLVEECDIEIPDIDDRLDMLMESDSAEKSAHGLIVEIAAIHAGTTSNFNHYSAEELEKSLESWTTPYLKPILKNHDLHEEPIGRIIGARIQHEADGTPYVMLQAAILDPDAIRKVSDRRYLTGSVGGKAGEALCSICNTNWAAPREANRMPCVHKRGTPYKGKIATIDMKEIAFKEYSIVNLPADNQSSIRSISTNTEETSAALARVFVLDMNQESIEEYNDTGVVDVLAPMKEREAKPLYLGLKGAFLSALAIHESELEHSAEIKRYNQAWAYLNVHGEEHFDQAALKDMKEKLLAQAESNGIDSNVIVDNFDATNCNDLNFDKEKEIMATDTAESVETEDIIAIVEGLSADDEAVVEEQDEKPTPDGDNDGDSDDSDDAENTDQDEVNSDDAEDAPEDGDDQEDGNEGERPEGQERPHAHDVDPDNSDGAPINRESDDEEESVDEPEESDETSDDEESNLAEENDESDESSATELEARVTLLETENTKLRSLLHHALAERVVDVKIRKGLVSVDDRAEAVKEHAQRTASSLADTLKDTMGLADVNNYVASTKGLEMQVESVVVDIDENATTIDANGDEIVADEKNPLAEAEDLMVDVFMGRRKA